VDTDPEADLDESALVRRWLDHRDQRAAEILWRRHQRIAVAIAARILGEAPAPVEEARGLADEIFVKALGTWDPNRSADSPRPFRVWYLSLVRNAAIDRQRRLGRLVFPAEAPEAAENPIDQMHDTIALRAALPRIRAWILEHYLPQDLALVEVWMAHQSEGSRVAWTDLAKRFPIDVSEVVRFPPSSDQPMDEDAIAAVARTLRLCPRIQLRVQGTATPQEPSDLAEQRAAAVCRALEDGLAPQTTRDPETGASVARLIAAATSDPGPPREEFEVTVGRLRTPQALRMRVTAVLLPKIAAVARGEDPDGSGAGR
jgi:DNA-directed RNA polymerase specialized sigma24 family protein